MQNIIKHSEAKKVDIQLSIINSHCILIVEDNGRGMANQSYKGMGLINIYNRLSTINGTINIESAKGGGTTVIINIGLKNTVS